MRRVLIAILGASLAAACANRAKPSIALYEAGDYAGAAREAESGLARHPNDDDLWQMRIRAALALGDADGVAHAYETYRGHRGEDDAELLRDLAVATLGQGLASPSAKLKIIAIEAVERAELQSLAEQVGERMGDEDDRVVATAAIAVLRGFPQAPQVADDMLRSEDPEARRIAVDGIGKKIGALALADLEKAAADPDPRVRRAAIRWLGQLGAKDAGELIARNLRHPDEGVRAAAATALARLGTGDLAAHAKRALADKALAVRLAGVELLVAGKRTDELLAVASDPDPMVGVEAAIAIKNPNLAAAALERAVTAERATIRAGAANVAVRAVGKPAAITLARRLADDPDKAVRLAAARTLASTGETDAAVAIFERELGAAVDGGRCTAPTPTCTGKLVLGPDVSLAAAADLARLDRGLGLAVLDTKVRDPKATPDERAAAAAAHATARRVSPGLVAALADPNGLVRVEAAAVLVDLAKPRD